MKTNKEMENIGIFLKAAEDYGVKKIDLFQVKTCSHSMSAAMIFSYWPIVLFCESSTVI